MSTWISEPVRGGLALAALVALSACDAIEGGMGVAPADRAEPLRRASLFGGEVVVAPPPGYCIDRSSTGRRRGGHVLLLAACQTLTGQPDMIVDPAVMTVSVLPRDPRATQPAATELAALLEPAPVLNRIDGDGVSIVHVGAGGQEGIPGGDPAYWRGAMVINGHLTGLALYAPQGSRVARGQAGETLIIELAERVRAASIARAGDKGAVTSTRGPDESADETGVKPVP